MVVLTIVVVVGLLIFTLKTCVDEDRKKGKPEADDKAKPKKEAEAAAKQADNKAKPVAQV